MRAGRNESRDCRCSANKIGCVDVNGVNVERNADSSGNLKIWVTMPRWSMMIPVEDVIGH